MARTMTVNVNIGSSYASGQMAGVMFLLKETMVAAGWTVQGSGDGSSFEWNGSTGGAGTGSGGAYDLWDTYTDAAGAGRWCLLTQPGGGFQFLMRCGGTGTTGTFTYSQTAAFTNSGIASATAPTAANQRIFFGAATITTAATMTSSTGYVHAWAESTATNGVYGFGYFESNLSTGAHLHTFSLFPLTNYDAADTQPWAAAYGTAGPTVFQAIYRPATTNTWFTSLDQVAGYNGFGGSGSLPGTTAGGLDQAAAVVLGNAATTPFFKGIVHTDFLLLKGVSRVYPDLFKIGSRYWCYTSGNYLQPWADAGTAPST